jgi:exodeoxyribonuclease-3
MKVATFNVNGITSRLPRVLEWLEEAQPDIACLQELKTSDDTFPRLAIEAAGYQAVWHGQKGFNGVAVLARGGGDLVERRRGLPGDPDDTHSRYLEASAHGLLVA